MFYTENEEDFRKYHSMGCGSRGDFKKIKPIWPGDPVKYECPVCGSEYRPAQEVEGQAFGFAGDTVDMFRRATDQELIEEMKNRGLSIEKKPAASIEKS